MNTLLRIPLTIDRAAGAAGSVQVHLPEVGTLSHGGDVSVAPGPRLTRFSLDDTLRREIQASEGRSEGSARARAAVAARLRDLLGTSAGLIERRALDAVRGGDAVELAVRSNDPELIDLPWELVLPPEAPAIVRRDSRDQRSAAEVAEWVPGRMLIAGGPPETVSALSRVFASYPTAFDPSRDVEVSGTLDAVLAHLTSAPRHTWTTLLWRAEVDSRGHLRLGRPEDVEDRPTDPAEPGAVADPGISPERFAAALRPFRDGLRLIALLLPRDTPTRSLTLIARALSANGHSAVTIARDDAVTTSTLAVRLAESPCAVGLAHAFTELGAPPYRLLASDAVARSRLLKCPSVPGFAPWTPADWRRFGGRDDVVAKVTAFARARLTEGGGPRWLWLTAGTGTGRTSLIEAGIAPALERGTPRPIVHVVRPGSAGNLEAVHMAQRTLDGLSGWRGSPPTVILVDDAEAWRDMPRGERRREIDALWRAASDPAGRTVVIAVASPGVVHGEDAALRADLGRALNAPTEAMPPLEGASLADAIRRPFSRAGTSLPAALVDRIVAEMDGNNVDMVVLGGALCHLLESRDPLADLARLGLAGAAAAHADACLEQIDGTTFPAARRVLIALAGETVPGGELPAAPNGLREPDLSPATRTAAEALWRCGLVVRKPDRWLLAHGRLPRAWPRLAGWLENLRHHRGALSELIDLFKTQHGHLLDGPMLGWAEHIATGAGDDLPGAVRDWVTASRTETDRRTADAARMEQDREQALALERAEHKRLERERLRELERLERAQQAEREAREAAERERQKEVVERLRVEDLLRQESTAREVLQSEHEVHRAALAEAQLRYRNTRLIPAMAGLFALTAIAAVGFSTLGPRRLVEDQLSLTAAPDLATTPMSLATTDPTAVAWMWANDPELARRNPTEVAGMLREPLSVAIFGGHEGPVRDARWSTDGATVATAGTDGIVRLFPAAGGPAQALQAHTAEVRRIAFIGADAMVTAGADRRVYLWSLKGGAPTSLGELDAAVDDLQVSPDGSTVLALSDVGTLSSFRIQATQSQSALTPPTTQVTAVAWGPAGHLAVATSDGHVRIQRADGTTSGFQLPEAQTRLRWSPDGERLAGIGRKPVAYTMPAQGGAWLQIPTFGANALDVAISNERVAVVGWNSDVLVTDFKNQRRTKLQGHRGVVDLVDFDADGGRLLTASRDGTAKVWDLTGGEPLTLTGHRARLRSARFSADGKQVLTASDDGTARLWPLDHDRSTKILSDGDADWQRAASWSTDGAYAIVGGNDGVARVWSADGTLVRRVAHPDAIAAAALDANGTRALVATGSVARIWSVQGDGPAVALTGHTGPINGVAFLGDGSAVLTASQDGTLRRWAADGTGEGSILYTLDGGNLRSVAVDVAGTRAVVTGSDNHARVVDLTTGAIVDSLATAARLHHAAVSDDGRRVALALADGAALVWTPGAGAAPVRLTGHRSDVYGVTFDRPGERVASAGADGTARIWSLDRPEVATVLSGHGHALRAVAFAPAGDRVLTASMDGTARLWWVPVGDPAVALRDDVPWCAETSVAQLLLGVSPANAEQLVRRCRSRAQH